MSDRRYEDDAVNDQAIAWLVQLHSGRANPQDTQAYHAWRAADPAHELAAREAESLWQCLARTRSAQRYRDAIPQRHTVQTFTAANDSLSMPPPGRQRRLAWSVVACLTLLVIGILQMLPSADQKYQTSIGQHRQIVLDDGSLLHLNTDTAVSVKYSASARELVLHKGEAFFQVQANKDRPFTVNTAHGCFQAVGTAFRIYRHDTRDELMVTEGTVAVTWNDSPNQIVRVSAGQAINLAANQPPEPVKADPVETIAWQRGKLVFNRRPLADVIKELNRYQPGFTVLMNENVAAMEITGVFELNDIDAALNLMADTLPIEITHLPYLTLVR